MADGKIQRVGMLGLGSMGGPMCANLAEHGFEVWAYDPRAEAVAARPRRRTPGCS
jgi:3-hydroxyisobutyrate dehydrogenase-like beta-hydroxyacid dehydrogenase